MSGRRIALFLALLPLSAGSCKTADQIELPPLPARNSQQPKLAFVCQREDSVGCEGNVHLTCRRVGEFLQIEREDCNVGGRVCSIADGCNVCPPDGLRCQPCDRQATDCNPQQVQHCNASGSTWENQEVCRVENGDTCYQGQCQNMCELATANRSYVGCEFYAADLDNAAIDDVNNASAQQYAVVVANPQLIPVDVKVEINTAAFGQPAQPQSIQSAKIPPGALEVFKLPRREVDGSSEFGLNDGTHSAATSNAYRVSSSHPVSAYQFNPLENVNVFSNDSSLLLPTSAIGSRYTVVSWPQTIGNSDNPEQDFDSTSSNEDLRAFLTVLGTEDNTRLTITLGGHVMRVVGADPIPEMGNGSVLQLGINRFDVINLETAGLNSDFTGSIVESNFPVTVFVGSEASDAPTFGTYATRQCCADHLEEQLIPDATLGSNFVIARTASRTEALAAALYPPATAGDDLPGVAVVNEPEWIRVLAVQPGATVVTTTLMPPDNHFVLEQGVDTILKAEQDFLLNADKPVSVLQVMGSQGVTGIPREYPGGDPSIIVVPPLEQYRRDYIFLTPDKYAFDFVTMMAEANATILFDGAPLPDTCVTSPADGIARTANSPPPDYVIHRCQLSFPIVTRGPNSQTMPGEQHDGVHTILSDTPVGVIVSGFDRFVSHAYPGGLNLQIIN